VTAADGSYELTGLRPGAIVVRIVTGGGEQCTAYCATPLTVTSGADAEVEPGVFAAGEISGRVAEDPRADGTAGPAGLAGRTVYLDLDGDGVRDAGDPARATGADGTYQFAGLAPGSYVVALEVPAAWTCSAPAPCRHAVTLAPAQSVPGQDFAAWTAARAAGEVTRDGAPLAGARVYDDADGDGAPGAAEAAATTGADGRYALELRPGRHTLRLQADGDAPCSSPSPCLRSVELVSGQAAGGLDFARHADAGETAPPPPDPTISGVAFEDRDADGAGPEAGETGVAGATVWLDVNGNGAEDAGEPVQRTSAGGRYAFTVQPGPHVVRVRFPGARWVCSVCARTVTVAAGEQAGHVDLGGWRKSLLTGVKFVDADRDGGPLQPGDPRLSGWRVYVDLNGNGRWDAAAAAAAAGAPAEGEPYDVTGSDGRYTITGIPGGRYAVREVPPAGSGYHCSFPATCIYTMAFTEGGKPKTADFGAVRPALVRHSARLLEAADSCAARAWTVRVRAGVSARRAVATVDGRRAAAGRTRDRHGRFVLRIGRRGYGIGAHRLRVRVTFVDGAQRDLRGTLYRCRTAAPRFTG
jgi:hypothetical protein